MSIEKAILRIALNGGEEFIKATDEKQANSMRVSAFNSRRKMPPLINEDVGIQKIEEEGEFFIRIFKRGIADATHWTRNPDSGKLVPLDVKDTNPEIQRMIELMMKDGKSDEEINEILKGANDGENA